MEKGVVEEGGASAPGFASSAGDRLAVRASVALTDRLGNRHRVIDDPTDAGCRPDASSIAARNESPSKRKKLVGG
jgi:hypothetical protein